MAIYVKGLGDRSFNKVIVHKFHKNTTHNVSFHNKNFTWWILKIKAKLKFVSNLINFANIICSNKKKLKNDSICNIFQIFSINLNLKFVKLPLSWLSMFWKSLKNITVTLCNKSKYIMLHYLMHIDVQKIEKTLLVELSQILTLSKTNALKA